ncbi:relaxase/mobilization nuclease domain-containing protein [Campylobacter hyointestinalis]|uniref:relaxase/mobilization nuclease domain-containing protein n=1 Tax=Campylobacter hyointestinalis TaxID=198 RepID=UPI000DCE7BC1|nr:relaxase/mobilization nuclease domain-containing protein [Campylobacter hyointestinalis]RAZ23976.1 relaxase [Campylobacter hyointestinalis subsp. lawsonii]RAZ38393.1 relaxase [Campylobacter hyointestinalis subsp. lawsonii]
MRTREQWDEFFKSIKAGKTIHSKNEHKNVSFGSAHISYAKNSFSKNAKQSVVKMISNLPRESIKRCIDYALKNSFDGYAINEKGERVGSDEVMSAWSKDFGTNKNSKDAWHLMFSINEPCNDKSSLYALQDAVKNILGRNFKGHKYAMVLHTHQNNPHVHVVLNKRNDWTKRKIHFDSREEIKDFFDEVRTDFAYSLGARGLKYENKNALHKDLKKEFSKIKSSINLERDDYTTKDRTLEMYDEMQEKNKNEYDIVSSRIKAFEGEIDMLKKANDELARQFLLYVQKKGKKRFRLGKELKQSNKILLQKRKDLIKEIKRLDKISFNATRLNDMYLEHYKDRSNALKLLENFSYNYNKIHPHGKGSSKADWLNYKKVRRSIAVLRGRDDEAKKYFDDSLIVTRLLGRNESLFKLNKKLEILDQSLYILNHSDASDDEKNEFKKRLDDNKEFITGVCKKRFEYVENKLLKSENIKGDEFLFKEYFKGIALLNKEPNERLLKIKKEADLMAKIITHKTNKSRSHSNSLDKQYKNIERVISL